MSRQLGRLRVHGPYGNGNVRGRPDRQCTDCVGNGAPRMTRVRCARDLGGLRPWVAPDTPGVLSRTPRSVTTGRIDDGQLASTEGPRDGGGDADPGHGPSRERRGSASEPSPSRWAPRAAPATTRWPRASSPRSRRPWCTGAHAGSWPLTKGNDLYLKREGSVEPVFGQVKSDRGANRFLRRGRSAGRSKWRLLTATHSLLKLHRHSLATT